MSDFPQLTSDRIDNKIAKCVKSEDQPYNEHRTERRKLELKDDLRDENFRSAGSRGNDNDDD